MIPLVDYIMDPSRNTTSYKPSKNQVKEIQERFIVNEPQAGAIAAAINQPSGFVLVLL